MTKEALSFTQQSTKDNGEIQSPDKLREINDSLNALFDAYRNRTDYLRNNSSHGWIFSSDGKDEIKAKKDKLNGTFCNIRFNNKTKDAQIIHFGNSGKTNSNEAAEESFWMELRSGKSGLEAEFYDVSIQEERGGPFGQVITGTFKRGEIPTIPTEVQLDSSLREINNALSSAKNAPSSLAS